MPFDAAYTASGVAFRFYGAVTSADIRQANREVHAHSYEKSLRYCLLDLTDAAPFDVDTETIERAAERDRAQLANQPEVLVAIVAPEPLQFGVARIWQAWVEGAPINPAIVNSRTAALEFLRLHGAEI